MRLLNISGGGSGWNFGYVHLSYFNHNSFSYYCSLLFTSHLSICWIDSTIPLV